MIARFKTSLTSPRKIGKYKDDRTLFALLYIFILSMLVIIPTAIMTIRTSKVSESVNMQIRRALVENKEVMPKGGIINGKLEIDKPIGFFMGKMGVEIGDCTLDSLEAAKIGSTYTARMTEEGIELLCLSVIFETYTYEELGITNLDFDFIWRNDDEGFKILEDTYNKMFRETQSFWKPISIFTSLFSSFFGIVVAALLYALIGKLVKSLPYKQMFNISLYSLSVSMIFSLFGNLYNLLFLNAIGGLVAVIYLVLALRNADEILVEEE